MNSSLLVSFLIAFLSPGLFLTHAVPSASLPLAQQKNSKDGIDPLPPVYRIEDRLAQHEPRGFYLVDPLANEHEEDEDEDNNTSVDGSSENIPRGRLIGEPEEIPLKLLVSGLLGNDVHLQENLDFLKSVGADKRAREFIGKRAREFIGKRAREFIGKRAREFIGKRAREFIGKRAREFIGKRNDDDVLLSIGHELVRDRMYPIGAQERMDGKRAREFIGKRAREFIGKRAREFIGKRAREFIGKRAREFIGKRAREFIGKRTSEFIRKRNAGLEYEEPAKRAREFIGKRAREFIGKRAREFIGKRSDIEMDKRLREFIGKRSDIEMDKRLREFIGKRSDFEMDKRLREFIGKRSDIEMDKRVREFIGKRAGDHYKFDDGYFIGSDGSIDVLTRNEPIASMQLERYISEPSMEDISMNEAFLAPAPYNPQNDLLLAAKRHNEFIAQQGGIDMPLSKRPREFIGKRSSGFEMSASKRPREFIGKRNSADEGFSDFVSETRLPPSVGIK